ncbi:hypothetical protein HMPREF0201_02639 [Cedecea davisae DSM 4568]|uniref:Uncharacterized protein n=1 Tax=Cedecea davisae DSM 4568 TaxID=566551 RepID=S3J892_9ENTR|nr:hypothetical protein HMPREF0201_02639 [Cedecea davisae DSM 4568]
MFVSSFRISRPLPPLKGADSIKPGNSCNFITLQCTAFAELTTTVKPGLIATFANFSQNAALNRYLMPFFRTM